MSEFNLLLDKMSEILLLQQKIKTKEELLDKLKPYLDDHSDLSEKLNNHLKDQNEDRQQSFNIYNQGMIEIEKNAIKFITNKTSDQLKNYLADQYVPYNSWKNANHDELVKLVLELQ